MSGCSSTDRTVLIELVLVPLHPDDDHPFALLKASFNFDSLRQKDFLKFKTN